MHDTIIRYLKVGSLILLGASTLGVLLYKVASSDIAFAAQALETSDILAILLAIFSVILSVMFYFKSTEESSRFYNNSYQFTKEMSELLGRIEAGFGERLRHIDEGYSTIGSRLDDVIALQGQARERLKEEEEDVEAVSEDRDNLIAALLERTNISEEEKEKFKKDLEEKEQELHYAQRQVMRYRRQARDLEESLVNQSHLDPDLERALEISSEVVGIKHFYRAPKTWLSRRLREHRESLPPDVFSAFEEHGIWDSDEGLSESGRDLLRGWASSRNWQNKPE